MQTCFDCRQWLLASRRLHFDVGLAPLLSECREARRVDVFILPDLLQHKAVAYGRFFVLVRRDATPGLAHLRHDVVRSSPRPEQLLQLPLQFPLLALKRPRGVEQDDGVQSADNAEGYWIEEGATLYENG